MLTRSPNYVMGVTKSQILKHFILTSAQDHSTVRSRHAGALCAAFVTQARLVISSQFLCTSSTFLRTLGYVANELQQRKLAKT